MNYVSKLNCNNNFYIDIFSPQQSNFKFDTTIQFSSWSGIDDDLIPSFISKKISASSLCIIICFS